MAFLILDLDLTLVCEESQENDLDQSVHTLHPTKIAATVDFVEGLDLSLEFIISLINPEETRALIEHACTEHDGIIILTAGCWSEDFIKSFLKCLLNFSPLTNQKVDQCLYVNALTTMDDFGLTITQIADIKKNRRFQKLLDKHPELRDKYFAALDDNALHVDSFNTEKRITAVRATTNEPSKSFYQETVFALARAKNMELNETITPKASASDIASSRNGFFVLPELDDDEPLFTETQSSGSSYDAASDDAFSASFVDTIPGIG